MSKVQLYRQVGRDFVIGRNNGVTAVYVVGEQILSEEAKIIGIESARTLIGAPFVSRQDCFSRPCGVCYLNQFSLDNLLKGAIEQGALPEKLNINGFEVSHDELVPMWAGNVPYVPFTGFYDIDVKENFKTRDCEDYRRMVERVLPVVHNQRAYVAQEEARAKPLVKGLPARLFGPKPFNSSRDYRQAQL